jgi:hypothetical protein
LSISANRLRNKVKIPDRLTLFDFYFVKIVDSLSSVVILSSIYDFTLYCSHELLHHNMDLPQDSQTSTSYYQAATCLTLVFVEIYFMYSGIRELNINKLKEYATKMERL